jgi:YgiT-type zinc finger domain-containing protein
MKCVICKTGDCFPGRSHFVHVLHEKLVVVKNLPANVCNNCGEAYFDTATVNVIQANTNEALKLNEKVEMFSV